MCVLSLMWGICLYILICVYVCLSSWYFYEYYQFANMCMNIKYISIFIDSIHIMALVEVPKTSEWSRFLLPKTPQVQWFSAKTSGDATAVQACSILTSWFLEIRPQAVDGWFEYREHMRRDHSILPILGGIKQYKQCNCMVNLRDFPLMVHC